MCVLEIMDIKYITTEDGYYWRVWEQKDYDKAPFEAQQMYEFGMFYWGVKVGRWRVKVCCDRDNRLRPLIMPMRYV